MKFYLGTHMIHWLWTLDIPLFMSHRRLKRNKNYYPATAEWCLDSGGFSELSLYDRWVTTPEEYIQAIKRYEQEMGNIQWAAPQDWMCEPHMLKKTGLSIKKHQELTIDSFIRLSSENILTPIIPVLQGWEQSDYLDHVEQYTSRGIDLTKYTVGVGSVCRRQHTLEIADILTALHSGGLSLHGFGVKSKGLRRIHHLLTSADSLAWCVAAKFDPPLEGHTHKTCSSCLEYALQWRSTLLNKLTPVSI